MTTRVTRRRIGAAILGVASVAAVTVGATTALFTDSDTISGNVVAVGSIDLVADSAAVGAFSVPTMMPGDEEFKAFSVENDGTMELRYAMTSTKTAGDDALAALLDLDVKSVADTSDCDSSGWATATAVAGPVDFGATAGLTVFGDPTNGAVGDRDVAGGATDILCVRVSLPDTATTAQGATATATFTFNAEQTANN